MKIQALVTGIRAETEPVYSCGTKEPRFMVCLYEIAVEFWLDNKRCTEFITRESIEGIQVMGTIDIEVANILPPSSVKGL